MNTKLAELIATRQDMHSMAFNYFYDGWKYRVKQEGYEAVARDCSVAATEIVTKFEKLVKEVYEDTHNK